MACGSTLLIFIPMIVTSCAESPPVEIVYMPGKSGSTLQLPPFWLTVAFEPTGRNYNAVPAEHGNSGELAPSPTVANSDASA